MVYCGIYPADGGESYENLKLALEKLGLNDASLEYEPENSLSLGSGFRCGFLGLLHLEVVIERLNREFNLSLITTLPSVIYKVHKTDGNIIDLYNPSELPDMRKNRIYGRTLCRSNNNDTNRIYWKCNEIMPR